MATINGGAGNDALTGLMNEMNTIQGLAGNDILTGANKTDYLFGGDGNDALFGGEDFDRLSGGAGNDRLFGGEGDTRDILIGGAGVDRLSGGAGADDYVIDRFDTIVEAFNGGIDNVTSSYSMTLGSNLENLFLQGPAAKIGIGNRLDNSISCYTQGADLRGGAGNDTLLGFTGDDILNGGDGRDVLFGKTGDDILTGGAGRDTFYFDLGWSKNGNDTITDFQHATDVIDFTGVVDANRVLPGAQDFVFVGKQAFDGAGEVRFTLINNPGTANDFTRVEAEATGDGKADFSVMLKGLHNLTAVDFEF